MRRNNSKDGTSIKQNRTTRHVDHIKQRYFKPSVKLDNPDESRYTDIHRWDSYILKECNATLPLSTISPSSWSCSKHSHSTQIILLYLKMDLSGRLSNSLNKLLKGKGRILCNLVNVYVVWTHLWTVWVNGMTMVWIGFLKDIGII